MNFGKRGEGWFLLQILLLVLLALTARWYTVALPLSIIIIGIILLAAGGMMSLSGIVNLGNNITPFPKPRSDTKLITSGVYSYIRHPIYSGLVFGIMGWSLVIGSIPGMILSVVFFIFFDQKTRHEERWLTERFPEYEDYKRRVRKLVPFIY